MGTGVCGGGGEHNMSNNKSAIEKMQMRSIAERKTTPLFRQLARETVVNRNWCRNQVKRSWQVQVSLFLRFMDLDFIEII